MKLYYHPASTTSRIVQLFALEQAIPLEYIVVDLFSGAQHAAEYTKINPNALVPVWVDGDFVLTESAAILKYLADQFNSPAYPKELKARARINERIDWFNSNFYKDIGYGLVYPQLFAHHARPDAIVQQGSIEWAQSKTKAWLAILNTNLIGDKNAYLCGDQITLCDYFGIELVLIGELVGSEYEAYPNIKRWMNNMKQLKNWTQVHTAFDGFVASLKGKTFIRI